MNYISVLPKTFGVPSPVKFHIKVNFRTTFILKYRLHECRLTNNGGIRNVTDFQYYCPTRRGYVKMNEGIIMIYELKRTWQEATVAHLRV